MKTTSNEFIAEMPDSWEDRTMTTLVGPADGSGFAANTVIVRERVTPRTSIEDYAGRQRQLMAAQIADLQVLDERPATLNGRPAYRRLQRFSAQGRRVQQMQTFVLADTVIYTITCTAAADTFNQHTSAFERIRDSFRVISSQTAAG